MNKERLGIWNENLSEIDERRELIELIQERIHIAKLELVDLNLHEAKRVYAEIMDLYNHLDSNDKSKVYQDIKDLYYNRKRAERVHKNKLTIYGIPLILSLFIISFLFISKPEITGYIVLGQEKMFGDNLNLIINESGSYIWQLKNPGDLKSIKVSGTVENRGSAKVYVEHKDKRYLILDSNKLVESDVLNKITGFVVAQGKESTQSNSSPIRNSDAERLGVNEMTDITSIKDIITDKSITEGTINETPILNKTLEKRIINKTDEAINQTLILNEKINEFNNNLTIKNDSILENNNPINDNLNNEVINNISFNNQTINKSIEISLEYKSGTDYDANDDGVEYTTGIIDLTIENSNFNWDVDESNLCARWETYSVENEESTFVCYGSSRCCQFVDLLAAKPAWDEPFYSAYGQYGATFNNIVSAQVLYVDYGLSVDDPYAEIYNSEWADLSASYFAAFTEFEDICVETCILFGFNETSYKLIFEINNTILKLDLVNYKILEAIDKVQVNIDIVDSNGFDSGAYNLYKDNVSVTVIDKFVEPDYYDLEIIPKENIINKITIKNVNITSPLIAAIGVDKVSREQEIKNLEIKKQYAVDVSEVDFETATLNAVAEANSLFKCKQWDYVTEVCYGTWEKIKDLIVGEEYSLTITADDPGFVEGNSEIEIINITPVNISELTLIKNIPNITIINNNNISIDLNQYFLNLDNNTLFTYFDIENIDIIFYNNTATVVPGKDFIGKRFTFITANKSNELVSSNIFSITVTNATINITPEIILKKKDFKLDEDVELDFEYLDKEDLVAEGKWKDEFEVYEEETEKIEAELELLRLELLREKIKEEEKLLSETEKAIKKQKKKWQKETESVETLVFDSEGKLKDIDIDIEQLREGKLKIKLNNQRAFRAGKYTIKLELVKDGVTYTQEQDFTWGVLAINVNKSIYLPNEDSFIGIAVLDDQGHMVCDADVTLEIISPLNQKTILSTINNDNNNISNNNSNNKLNNKNIIKVSPECKVYGVTNLPDYYTDYSVNGVGNYTMNLTAVTYNGVRNIIDKFVVQENVDFDVARQGPTRIYPLVPYNMDLTIKANKDYNGVINEYVPASFEIMPQQGLTITTINDTKILSWNKNLIDGETYHIDYEFDAPDISPEFYLLSPLEIGSFRELRNWQVASDVTSYNPTQHSGRLSTGCTYGSSGTLPGDVQTGDTSDFTQTGITTQGTCTDATAWADVYHLNTTISEAEGDVTQIDFTYDGDCSRVGAGNPPTRSIGWYDWTNNRYEVFTTGGSGATCDGNDVTSSESLTVAGDIQNAISANGIISIGLCFIGGNKPCSQATTTANNDLVLIDITTADTTPPGVNITNINQTKGQDIRINDVLNVTCQSFDSPTVGNITFNLTGDLDLYNFSFELTGTSSNFSQNITMNLTRGHVVNATCWAADTDGNTAQNSTLITIANTNASQASILFPPFNDYKTNLRPLDLNVTFPADPDTDVINITYYINGVINQTQIQLNTTFNASDGIYILNVSLHDNVTPLAYSANATINFTIDTTVPVVNATLNKSFTNIVFGDVINLTANITDNIGLLNGSIIINDTGFKRYFNFSLAGKTEFSQNITISCFGSCVINFTARVNDTGGNYRTNDTIITVVDDIVPVVNTSLNKSLTDIFENDVINFSANITDEVGLSFCQIIINQSGPDNLEIINVSLSGTNGQCYNVSEVTLGAGGVINFTIRVNDTSNNFRTNDTIIEVASAANPPIIKLNNVSISNPAFAVDPVSGGSVEILLSFNVTDADGVATINASKTIVNLTLGGRGGQFRFNVSDQGNEFGTCSNHTETGPGAEADRVIINCTIVMWYYDNASSNWYINVSVEDINGNVGRNDTIRFTYNELSAISLPVSYINFTSLFLGSQNQPAGGARAILNNTGNDDFDQINITGAAYIGQTISSETIGVEQFFVNSTNAVDGKGMPLTTGPQTIRALEQTTGLDNLTLFHGHTTAKTDYNDDVISSKGNQSLYFWLDVPNSGLSPQKYNNTWNITVIDIIN